MQPFDMSSGLMHPDIAGAPSVSLIVQLAGEFNALTFGPRILHIEIASVVALALLQDWFGDL